MLSGADLEILRNIPRNVSLRFEGSYIIGVFIAAIAVFVKWTLPISKNRPSRLWLDSDHFFGIVTLT